MKPKANKIRNQTKKPTKFMLKWKGKIVPSWNQVFDGTIDMLSQWDYIYFFNTFFNCRVIVKFVAQQMTIVSAWKYKERGLKYLQGHWSFKIALVSLFLKKWLLYSQWYVHLWQGWWLLVGCLAKFLTRVEQLTSLAITSIF